MIRDNERSVFELASDAFSQLGKLLSNEIQLAKTEMTDKVTKAAMGVAYIAAGAVITIPALVLLMLAFAHLLIQNGINAALAYFISGVIALVVSAALAAIGMKRLKPDALVPTMTIEQTRRDAALTREILK